MIPNSGFDSNITGWYASHTQYSTVSWDENEMGSGSLKIENKIPSFTVTYTPHVYNIIPQTVSNDKSYLLQFASKSDQDNKTLGVLLEPSGTYDHTNANLFSVKNTVTEKDRR